MEEPIPSPEAPIERVHRLIAELAAGDRIEDGVYLLLQKDLRTTNSGGMYIHAVLSDTSGQVLARMWNATQEIFSSLPESGLIRVCGRIESYKGRAQFIIDGVRQVEAGLLDPADYLPRTRFDIEQMWGRLKAILRSVNDRKLLALAAQFINNSEFAERFKRAPAARTNHHAFVGGLLEHTLNLLELAELVLPRYPRVNRDLVLTGIFLHDAGKTVELACQTNFDYTNEGQLVGHIVQAVIWVQEAAQRVAAESGEPFPERTLQALKHIIIAHHGKYEFGSPRLPATAEAFMVHYLDNIDAKMNMVFQAIDADESPGDWTGWVAALETRVFKGGPQPG